MYFSVMYEEDELKKDMGFNEIFWNEFAIQIEFPFLYCEKQGHDEGYGLLFLD